VKNINLIKKDFLQIKKKDRFLLVTEDIKGDYETVLLDLEYKDGPLQNYVLKGKDKEDALKNHENIKATIKVLEKENKDLSFKNFRNYLSTF